MKKYDRYSVEDFVTDGDFATWVKYPTPESEARWNDWLAENPVKKPLVDEARIIILSFQYKATLSEEEKSRMWQYIDLITEQEEITTPVTKSKQMWLHWGRWRQVAAVFLGILTVGLVLLFYLNRRDNEIVTRFGEMRTVQLPDGSVVTLNANSKITFGRTWDDRPPREVWLDGEAFFSVVHTANHQHFTVHTPDLNIEVLGTRFNVMKREGKTKVTLNSGKVKVNVLSGQPRELIMKPGELIEFSKEKLRVTQKAVVAENHSAWMQHKLVFDDTAVPELIQVLEDTYGWKVQVKDEAILHEKLSGEIQTDDEEALLNALSGALEVNITKEGNTLMLEKK